MKRIGLPSEREIGHCEPESQHGCPPNFVTASEISDGAGANVRILGTILEHSMLPISERCGQ